MLERDGRHVTRKEKRARRTQRMQTPSSVVSRRNFGRVIVGGSLALGAVAIYEGFTHNISRAVLPSPATLTPSPTPRLLPAVRSPEPRPTPTENQRVIQQEVDMRGIQQNISEELLWMQGYPRSVNVLPVNEITAQEAKRRLESTFILMQQSDNEILKTAAKELIRLDEEGIISIDISTDEHPTDAMGITFTTKNDKFHIRLNIDASTILNQTSASKLAIELAHEYRHIQNSLKRQQTLPADYTAQQRRDYELQRATIRDLFVEEEAQGYAVEAEAYIIHYGLGFRGGGGQEEYAAEYIRSGKNPASQRWKDYIRDRVLRLKG